MWRKIFLSRWELKLLTLILLLAIFFLIQLFLATPTGLTLRARLGEFPVEHNLSLNFIKAKSRWVTSNIQHYRITIELTWVGPPPFTNLEKPCRQEFEVQDEQIIKTFLDTCTNWPKLGLPETFTVTSLFSLIKSNTQLEWNTDRCTLSIAYPRYDNQLGYPLEIVYKSEKPKPQNMGLRPFLAKYSVPSGEFSPIVVSESCLDSTVTRPSISVINFQQRPLRLN